MSPQANNPRYFIYEPHRRVYQAYWLREPVLECSDEDSSGPDGDFLTEFTYLTAKQGQEYLHKKKLHLATFVNFLLESDAPPSEDRIFYARGLATLYYDVYLLKEACKLLGTNKNEDPRLEWHSLQAPLVCTRAQAYWDMLRGTDSAIVLR